MKTDFTSQVRKLVQHPENILVDSIESDLFERVAKEFAEERARLGYYPYQYERNRDWSVLNHQIVGQEDF